MATIYRLLSVEGKAVAREKARVRNQRARDARNRQAYLRVLQQIKKPRGPPWSLTDAAKPLRVGWISTARWSFRGLPLYKAPLLPDLFPTRAFGVVKGVGLRLHAIGRDG